MTLKFWSRREVGLSHATCFTNFIAIIQNPLINPPALTKSAHPVIKQDDTITYCDALYFYQIIEKIQSAWKKSYRVFVDGRVVPENETVEFSQNPSTSAWYLKSGEVLIAIRLYFELTFKPKFIYIDHRFFKSDLLNLILEFDKDYPTGMIPTSTADIIRRTKALAEFGIIWNEGFELICASLGKEKLLKITNTAIPFHPLSSFMSGDDYTRISLKDALREDPSKRIIVGPMINTLAGYRNPDTHEATLNSKLWTPLLDALLLPDESAHQSRLYSTTEYAMDRIRGFERKLRVDYVVRTDQVPLAVVEYAAAHDARPVPKDFTKSAVMAASLLLDFISKYPDRREALEKIHMSILYISSTEFEFALLRPIFDPSLNLKGFSLTTNPDWIFDIQSPRDGRRPLDVAPFVGNNTYSVRSGTLSIGSDFKPMPNVPVTDRSIDCPERLILEQADYDAFAFLRGLGLYLNGFGEQLNQLFPDDRPDDPLRPTLVYSPPLQKSIYTQAITSFTTPGAKPGQVKPAESRSPSDRPRKKAINKALDFLFKNKFDVTKLKRSGNSIILQEKIFEGGKFVFLLKPLMELEWLLLKTFAGPLEGLIPKPRILKRFDSQGLLLVGGERPIPLVQQIMHGGFGSLWYMYMPERIGAMLVDMIIVISALWKHGFVQADISWQSIVYSSQIHSWTFGTFDKVFLVTRATVPYASSPEFGLSCLAKVARSIVQDLGMPRIDSINGLGPQRQPKLDELLDFCSFLESKPSLLRALEKAHDFYKQHKNCSRLDVKFQNSRFRRLKVAIESNKPSPVSENTAPPAHENIVHPASLNVPVVTSPLKRPAPPSDLEDERDHNSAVN